VRQPQPRVTGVPPSNAERTGGGYPCPKCGSPKSVCYNSRPREGTVHRCRACPGCGHRWSTREVHTEDLYRMQAAEKILEQAASLFGKETGSC